MSLNDDKYFAAVGRIVTIASNADLVLFNTFRVLTNLPAGVASSIYYALDALPTKIRMIHEVARQTCNDKQAPHVGAITHATKLANNVRIEVAHAAKINMEGKFYRATPRRHQQPYKPMSNAEVEQMLVRVNNYYKVAKEAFTLLCELRGVQPDIKISRLRDAHQSGSRTPSTPDRPQEGHPRQPQEQNGED